MSSMSVRAHLALIVATAAGARLVPTHTVARAPDDKKKRILMLISDTGGGHRASAIAVEEMMQQLRPEIDTDIKVVDIWTEYGNFPYNKMAAGYPFLCKHPYLWRSLYHSTKFLEKPWALTCRVLCGAGFKRCIDSYQPDLVVSLHPLCQHLPLQILRQNGGKAGRTVPFATVCTDLGSAHTHWFLKEVDACFVPSDAVRKIAQKRGIADSKIRQYGLPVRRPFWSCEPSKTSQEQAAHLGLLPDKKTVLVVGGGDGVGSLSEVVEATAAKLAADCPGSAQVVALCGKNAAVRRKLEAKAEEWDGVHVEVRGFTSEMSSYMEVADCLVTKAGPGTIAEASIRGLPTILSSFLPGQEAGNVPFVVQNGFGEFARSPQLIAKTVSAWLQDDKILAQRSAAARAAAAPQATKQIAEDLLKLLD